MVNSTTGINFNVFIDAISKYGDTAVSYIPVTKTESNLSGQETLTDGTPVTINAYIVRKNAPWYFEKSGQIQGGDALIVVKPTQTLNKNDKITWNGNTYRIQDVLNRDQLGGTVAYKVGNLFKI